MNITLPPQEMPSPDWHAQELVAREAAIARGEDTFEAWETARRQIEQSIR